MNKGSDEAPVWNPRKRSKIGRYKGAAESAAFCLARVRSGTAGEHHEQAVILSAVVPRTPGQIDREYPRKNAQPEMRK